MSRLLSLNRSSNGAIRRSMHAEMSAQAASRSPSDKRRLAASMSSDATFIGISRAAA